MTRHLRVMRGVLRGRRVPPPRLIAMGLAGAAIGGAATASFSVTDPGRALLIPFGAINSPLLLITTALVATPGLIVTAAALGMAKHTARLLSSVWTAQAVSGVALASLAPVTLIAYTAISSHRLAIAWNLAVFTAASLAGAAAARRRLRGLDRGARALLLIWLVLYGAVGIQAAWMARPFVGSPGLPVRFLREEWLSNGYVALYRVLFGA